MSDESHSVVPRKGDVHHSGPGAPSLAQPCRDEGRRQGTLSPRRGCLVTRWRDLSRSSQPYGSRQRRSSTSSSGVMHRPLLPPGTGLHLPVTVGALLRPPVLLRPAPNCDTASSLSQESGAPRVQAMNE